MGRGETAVGLSSRARLWVTAAQQAFRHARAIEHPSETGRTRADARHDAGAPTPLITRNWPEAVGRGGARGSGQRGGVVVGSGQDDRSADVKVSSDWPARDECFHSNGRGRGERGETVSRTNRPKGVRRSADLSSEGIPAGVELHRRQRERRGRRLYLYVFGPVRREGQEECPQCREK